MLTELGIDTVPDSGVINVPVFQGGPVESARGFILHSADYNLPGMTLDVVAANGFTACLTTSRDILSDMAQGRGPRHFRVALGYAGWGEGQLETELARNDWLVAPVSHELLFATDPANLWEQSLSSLGVAPEHLSATAGTA
jgi:putative transcriptional regulator